jgi:hypothetical protein
MIGAPMSLPSPLRRTLLAVSLGCGCALAAVAAAAPAAAGACATSGLSVWLDTTGSGAAGSIYYKLELTNLSGRRCTLFGYPGVSAVNLRSRQIGSAAGRNPVVRPHTITLRNGATATAVLQITEAGNYPRSDCRQVTAAGLRVYPPGQKQAKLVPFPFAACSRTRATILHVEAVTASTAR